MVITHVEFAEPDQCQQASTESLMARLQSLGGIAKGLVAFTKEEANRFPNLVEKSSTKILSTISQSLTGKDTDAVRYASLLKQRIQEVQELNRGRRSLYGSMLSARSRSRRSVVINKTCYDKGSETAEGNLRLCKICWVKTDLGEDR